jgi:hypothetical protein
VFDEDKINASQFRESNLHYIKIVYIVLESLGQTFECDEEFLEYFNPIDSDRVSNYIKD